MLKQVKTTLKLFQSPQPFQSTVRFSTLKSAESKPYFYLLVFGAPGVGKGTYSKLIENNFKFASFSMGEYFRSLINDDNKKDTEFIEKVRGILRSGQLIDDNTVVDVLKNVIESK